MNRITQCMHGRGTVSDLHRHGSGRKPRHLAFSGMNRPVIFWNLTNACNLQCIHCYSGSDMADENELSTDEARRVIDDLAVAGVPLILFTGGEPLLRHDIFELAGYAREKGLSIALSSNGTLIDATCARRIKESGISYVGISLDGADAATHNRFRGSDDAFERTTAAFAHCLDAGLRCGVRVTLTRENLGELEPLIDLAADLGASRFCLYWLVPTGRGIDGYDRLQLDGGQVIDALNLLYRKAKEIDPAEMEFLTVDAPQDAIHLLASMRRDESPDLPDAERLVASLNGGCSAGTKVANIDHLGDIYPCQFARSETFRIGNIRKTPFAAIWDDDTNPVLRLFRTPPAAYTGRCGSCSHQVLCGGGCRVRAYMKNGEFFAEDPFCFISGNGDSPI
ncbi:radical SAM protein with 4Fe4S-binding SPASM domain [Methanocalculus alkaliphilus]|uniref:radical SAM/SPASM domain-containing protein n=1 Tax=Methanocalculus alkaliphilus TaxID=768730 RepID=UPI0020A183C3|nr:radical SAM protein [Methanocalculus alkaliphilus]MCP1715583.1 radical SAM protein with 4Fe4S-binding SPASM domain [Methanocalculus alkaliphilus]